MIERSSKLMMNNEMSSTSLLTGAITSLHRNLDPENHKIILLITCIDGSILP